MNKEEFEAVLAIGEKNAHICPLVYVGEHPRHDFDYVIPLPEQVGENYIRVDKHQYFPRPPRIKYYYKEMEK